MTELPGTPAEWDSGDPYVGIVKYRILPEPLLSETLESASEPRTYCNDRIDGINFQPSRKTGHESQDRSIAGEWEMPDGIWSFAAVFDGHGGEQTSEHAVKSLPEILHGNLKAYLDSVENGSAAVDTVSSILKDSIITFDNKIRDDVIQLLPGAEEELSKLSDQEIKCIVNDSESGGSNHVKTQLAMAGSTALIALVDPSKRNLWIANLGDCQATIGGELQPGEFKAELITQDHNGLNPLEVERVRKEHSNEVNVLATYRVLDAIMVTRAIGDIEFKLPSIYTKRVFLNAEPPFRTHTKVETYVDRILSPPYLSNIADIHHRILEPEKDKFIILASDGLTDLYREKFAQEDSAQAVRDGWIKLLLEQKDAGNKALALLRFALGGDDEEEVSKQLTTEVGGKYLDDTSILVMSLESRHE